MGKYRIISMHLEEIVEYYGDEFKCGFMQCMREKRGDRWRKKGTERSSCL